MVRHLALSVNVGKGSEPRAQTPNAENVLQKICRALGVIVDVKVYKNGNFCKCENVAEQPRLSLIALQESTVDCSRFENKLLELTKETWGGKKIGTTLILFNTNYWLWAKMDDKRNFPLEKILNQHCRRWDEEDENMEVSGKFDYPCLTERYAAGFLCKRFNDERDDHPIPALLFVSYHGQTNTTNKRGSDIPLTERQKTQNATDFMEISCFTAAKLNVPLLVGGDFNAYLTAHTQGQPKRWNFPSSGYGCEVTAPIYEEGCPEREACLRYERCVPIIDFFATGTEEGIGRFPLEQVRGWKAPNENMDHDPITAEFDWPLKDKIAPDGEPTLGKGKLVLPISVPGKGRGRPDRPPGVPRLKQMPGNYGAAYPPAPVFSEAMKTALLAALHDETVLEANMQGVIDILQGAGEMGEDENGEPTVDLEKVTPPTAAKLYDLVVVKTGRAMPVAVAAPPGNAPANGSASVANPGDGPIAGKEKAPRIPKEEQLGALTPNQDEHFFQLCWKKATGNAKTTISQPNALIIAEEMKKEFPGSKMEKIFDEKKTGLVRSIQEKWKNQGLPYWEKKEKEAKAREEASQAHTTQPKTQDDANNDDSGAEPSNTKRQRQE